MPSEKLFPRLMKIPHDTVMNWNSLYVTPKKMNELCDLNI